MSANRTLADNGKHLCLNCADHWQCYMHSGCDSHNGQETICICPDCKMKQITETGRKELDKLLALL